MTVNFPINTKAILTALAVSMAFMFWGCGPNNLYEKEYQIPNEAWTYDNQLSYTTTISDTNRIYNLYLDITHSTEYSKQNLYVQFHTQFPSNEKIKERVSFDLADKLGRWKGSCGSTHCDLSIPIQQGAFFNQAGEYTFTVEQYMRLNPLEGVQSVAFRIEETEDKRK